MYLILDSTKKAKQLKTINMYDFKNINQIPKISERCDITF